MTESHLIADLTRTAHNAAWQAGQIIRETINNPTNIQDKGPRDLVTDTDHAAQTAILEVIRHDHPEHHIVAEEGQHQSGDGWHFPDGVVWLVDPLDGTTNFTRSLPMVCVSVGALLDGEPVAGAIYDPIRQDFFLAGKGLGTMLNGHPLLPISARRLDDAIIALDWSHAPANRNRALKTVSLLADKSRTVRSLGSAALALAYVAAGRLDMYFNFSLQPWDQAAGATIIREVGGALHTPEGDRWQPGESSLFAAHPDLLKEVLPIVAAVVS